MIRNVHERDFKSDAATVGALIDTLASPGDRLWPRDRWPAMRFDRPLQVGAVGGHGPVHYIVVAYEPSRSIRLRFTAPRGFIGSHGFDVVPLADGGARLVHSLGMQAESAAILAWPLAYRWLHDALIEDSLDRAAMSLGETPRGVRWTLWVRILRWVAGVLA